MCAGTGRRGPSSAGEQWGLLRGPRVCCPAGLCTPAGRSGSPPPGAEPCGQVPAPRAPHGCPLESPGWAGGWRHSLQRPWGTSRGDPSTPWGELRAGPLPPHCQWLDVKNPARGSDSPAARAQASCPCSACCDPFSRLRGCKAVGSWGSQHPLWRGCEGSAPDAGCWQCGRCCRHVRGPCQLDTQLHRANGIPAAALRLGRLCRVE